MTKREKSLIRFLAANLEARAKNARDEVKRANGPAESITKAEGAAYAFQVSVDYLIGAIEGYEKLPSMKDLVSRLKEVRATSDEGNDYGGYDGVPLGDGDDSI